MTAARWPGMMQRKTAAAYCDLSVPSFEKEITAGRLPAGVMFGGREHWLKESLDKALARIAGQVDDDDEISKVLGERYGKAA